MNNAIGSRLSTLDQFALLADQDPVMRERLVVFPDGALVPVTEELVLSSTQQQSDFQVIPGNITDCGFSVVNLTDSGRARVDIILQLVPIRSAIVGLLTQAKHSLFTITHYIGKPFSEDQIRIVLSRMAQEGIIVQLPIVSSEIFSLPQ